MRQLKAHSLALKMMTLYVPIRKKAKIDEELIHICL